MKIYSTDIEGDLFHAVIDEGEDFVVPCKGWYLSGIELQKGDTVLRIIKQELPDPITFLVNLTKITTCEGWLVFKQ